MNFFDLSPEELSTLALVVAIGLSKKYTDDDELGILAVFFNGIGDNLAIIQLQRLTLAQRASKAEGNNSSGSDS